MLTPEKMKLVWTICISWLILLKETALGFSLDLIHEAFNTASLTDFGYDQGAFDDAITWQRDRVSSSSQSAPFIGCTHYGHGRDTKLHLEDTFGIEAVYTAYHSQDSGSSCFVFHAHHTDVDRILQREKAATSKLQHLAPLPDNLKV